MDKHLYRCGKPNYYENQICDQCNIEKEYIHFKKSSTCKTCRAHKSYLKYKEHSQDKMTERSRKKYWEQVNDPIKLEKMQNEGRARYLKKKQKLLDERLDQEQLERVERETTEIKMV